MMRVIRRAGQALVALALTLALLTAPAAWAVSGPAPGPDGWLAQLWDLVTAWIAPSERGASMDPSGLQTSANEATTYTNPTWEPIPVGPSATDASTEDDDSGASMDPSG